MFVMALLKIACALCDSRVQGYAFASVWQSHCMFQLGTQGDRAQHSTVQHSTAQHSTAQHSTAQHSSPELRASRQDTLQKHSLWQEGHFGTGQVQHTCDCADRAACSCCMGPACASCPAPGAEGMAPNSPAPVKNGTLCRGPDPGAGGTLLGGPAPEKGC